MKILFIAPIGFATSSKQVQAIHAGYGNASFGILFLLDCLKKEGIISELEVVDTSNANMKIPADNDFDVAIMNYPPTQFSQNTQVNKALKAILSKAKKKYYHIVWETEPLPLNFSTIFEDDFFDGFFAPSEWGMKQIEEKTNKPVFYLPHFVPESDWNLIDINKKINEKLFTVLFLGQNTIRKGIRDAVIGFARALGNKPDCNLLLKLTVASPMEIPIQPQINSLLRLNQTNLKAKVDYIDADISNEELGSLYELSSLFLFCSRGEGFGLPAAEAMLQGLPVIYTNFSACPEVCISPVNTGVSAFIDEAHSMSIYGYEKGLKYGIPKISDIVQALEFYYFKWKEDKQKYYETCRINRDIIIQKFSYEPVRKHYLKFFESIK